MEIEQNDENDPLIAVDQVLEPDNKIVLSFAVILGIFYLVGLYASFEFINNPTYDYDCDNILFKCKYYKTEGTLINNTIVETYENF